MPDLIHNLEAVQQRIAMAAHVAGRDTRSVHLLAALDIEVRLPADSHLCCGSAGTYSLTQPALSYTLRNQKLEKLNALEPQMIVSANVGCISHLQSGTSMPVAHWIELVEHMLSA